MLINFIVLLPANVAVLILVRTQLRYEYVYYDSEEARYSKGNYSFHTPYLSLKECNDLNGVSQPDKKEIRNKLERRMEALRKFSMGYGRICHRYIPTFMFLAVINKSVHYLDRRRITDDRNPVILLRPFYFDNVKTNAPDHRTINLELQLREHLQNRFGPLIVISNTEAGAKSGYKRTLSFENGDWKEGVMSLLGECGIILLVLESTEGVQWEAEQILQNEDLLRKTIFINLTPSACDYIDYPGETFGIAHDDGVGFAHCLAKLAGSHVLSTLPTTHIVTSFLIGNGTKIIAFKRLMDATAWCRSVVISMCMLSKDLDL